MLLARSTALSTAILAQHNFRTDGAPPHTRQLVFTIRAALAEVIPEILKSRTVPRLLDGMAP